MTIRAKDYHDWQEREFIETIDKYVTQKELAVYDFDGEKIKGENKFKTYKK